MSLMKEYPVMFEILHQKGKTENSNVVIYAERRALLELSFSE